MLKYIIIYAVISIPFISCKHEPLTGADAGGGSGVVTGGAQPCSADTVYFQNIVLPMLTSNCAMSGCHDAATRQNGVQLTDYSSIVNTGRVRPGNPGESKLYKMITDPDPNDRMPLFPRPPLSAVQIGQIRRWIEQGAKNNACLECDTAGVITYSLHISRLLQNNCAGCHNGPGGNAGVDLSNYNGVKTVVNSGKLRGVVNWLPGFAQMPKNGNQLQPCQLTQINKWIYSGAPNN